jgi:hypothetical protein
VTHILNGHREPGELALIKIERGVRTLGLDREAVPNGAA